MPAFVQKGRNHERPTCRIKKLTGLHQCINEDAEMMFLLIYDQIIQFLSLNGLLTQSKLFSLNFFFDQGITPGEYKPTQL